MKLEYKETKYCVIVVGRFANGLVIEGAGKTKQEAENSLWGQYNLILKQKL
jgi:hypothetical protein